MAELGIPQGAAAVKGNWKIVGKPTITVTPIADPENDQVRSIENATLKIEGEMVLLNPQTGGMKLVKFSANIKQADFEVSEAMAFAKGGRTEEKATKAYLRYLSVRNSSQQKMLQLLPNLDKTDASIALQNLADGSTVLAETNRSIDQSCLSENEKKVLAEFGASLVELNVTAKSLGIDLASGIPNNEYVAGDLGAMDFIGFILESIKTAKEALAKAMKGEQNDKTDEAKKFYDKKAQEKIDYAKSLKRKIDALISSLPSVKSANALFSLIDEIKGLLREVRSTIDSGQLPENLKSDLETFADKSEKKIESFRNISITA